MDIPLCNAVYTNNTLPPDTRKSIHHHRQNIYINGIGLLIFLYTILVPPSYKNYLQLYYWKTHVSRLVYEVISIMNGQLV